MKDGCSTPVGKVFAAWWEERVSGYLSLGNVFSAW